MKIVKLSLQYLSHPKSPGPAAFVIEASVKIMNARQYTFQVLLQTFNGSTIHWFIIFCIPIITIEHQIHGCGPDCQARPCKNNEDVQKKKRVNVT